MATIASALDTSTGARRARDLYEIGEIPPLGHVPPTMYAWTIRRERHGSPDQAMQLEVVPTWTIAADEVLILVMAAGVNYNGVWAALGTPVSPIDGHKNPVHIAGSDAAGIVWAVGGRVSRVLGSEGMLQNSNLRPTTVRRYTAHETEVQDPILNFFLERYVDAYRIELDLFAEAVEKGTPMPVTVRDGCKALRLADAAVESVAAGKAIKV
jgi:hypothetical protein